jgi:hypothetical protein
LAVEELDECAAGILAREVREDNCCDVGVLDPLVYEADTGIVDGHDGVVAVCGDVLD